MKKVLPYILLFGVVLASTVVISQSFRVSQIPNGGINSCQNCHVSALGGGTRNSFGQAVENGFLNFQGNVQWGPQLAALDSDGDGFSNGLELQDPNGTWTGGSIGDPSKVTNPGDPNSRPNTTSVAEESIPQQYKLHNNYPNPFNPSTKIAFEIPQAENVTLKIFNISGELIRTLTDESLGAGKYEKIWDGRDNTGNVVSSGIYIYRLNAGFYDRSARMILLK
ncbi:MAG: FlgD immunoglobulin-like domain containing protein [Melioribacteraceae bacterium]|nr:FlgD immunoglobulin-like domain containing protein [Melioribacteraceae bacterium]